MPRRGLLDYETVVSPHTGTAGSPFFVERTAPTIFVSATSRDLRSYREAVAEVLHTHGIRPDEQQYFGPDHRRLYTILRDKIAACDAVVCLIGHAFGAAPSASDGVLRSYTQIEYDTARRFGKPVYLFVTGENCPLDALPVDEPEQLTLQAAHRAAIQSGEYRWSFFHHHEDLRQQIAEVARALVGRGDRQPGRVLHPVAPPAFFAGREPELAQLDRALEPGGRPVVVILGIGGQGKTTLVAQWWRQHHQVGGWISHFDAAFWCSAYRSGFTFDAFLDEMLDYLLRGEFRKPSCPTLAQRAAKLIGLLQQRRVLVVIDGIERWLQGWNQGEHDPQQVTRTSQRRGFFEGLDDFLLQVSGIANDTRLVLTTRAMPAVLDDAQPVVVPVSPDGRQIAPLEGLDDESAARLLETLGVGGTRQQRIAIARDYDNHPLALVVLGRLLAEHFGGNVENLSGISALDPRLRIFELLEETRRHLPGRQSAEAFLHVVACAEEHAALPAIAAGLGAADPDDAEAIHSLRQQAVMLDQWQLVDWDSQRQVVRMHPLVKEYFASVAPQPQVIHQRLCRWYARQPMVEQPRTRDDIRPRLLAVHHALRADCGEAAAALFFAPLTARDSLVEWLHAWGHMDQAREMAERLVAATEASLRAELQSVHAATLRHLGRLDEALASIDTAIALFEGTGDQDASLQESLAGAWMNRGNIEFERRQHGSAMCSFDRAIEILRPLVAAGHAPENRLADALASRANTLVNRGQPTQAVAAFDEAIGHYQALADSDHPRRRLALALAISGRGNAHSESRRFQQAMLDFQRAEALVQALLAGGAPEYHRHLAGVQMARGCCLARQGRSAEAVEELGRALPVMQQLVEAGRGDLEASLGLLYSERAAANLQSRRHPQAQHDADRAVGILQRLVERGRRDLRGWLAEAFMRRSQVRRQRNDPHAAADQQAGLSLARLARTEDDNRMLSVVVVQYLIDTAAVRLATDADRAADSLTQAEQEVQQCRQADQWCEKLAIELNEGLHRLEGALADSKSSVPAADLSRVRQIAGQLARHAERESSGSK